MHIDFPVFLRDNGTEPRACACWASALALNYMHCPHCVILVGSEEEREPTKQLEKKAEEGKVT